MKIRLLNFFVLALITGLNSLPANCAVDLPFINLHNLVTSNGARPDASMTLIGNTLYGTAQAYGENGGSGSLFKVNSDGSAFTNMHTFSGNADGGSVSSSLILSGDTLFGTAAFGGASGTGTIFKIN